MEAVDVDPAAAPLRTEVVLRIDDERNHPSRTETLTTLAATFPQAKPAMQRRFARSLRAWTGDDTLWKTVATLALRQDSEDVQYAAVKTITDGRLTAENRRELLAIAARGGKGLARTLAQQALGTYRD